MEGGPVAEEETERRERERGWGGETRKMHRALIHENDDATIDVRTHGSIKVERSATPDHHGEGRRSRRMAKVGRKRRAESCFHVCRPLFSRFSRESLPSSKYVIDEADRRRKIERLLSSSSPRVERGKNLQPNSSAIVLALAVYKRFSPCLFLLLFFPFRVGGKEEGESWITTFLQRGIEPRLGTFIDTLEERGGEGRKVSVCVPRDSRPSWGIDDESLIGISGILWHVRSRRESLDWG